jgi:Skp family chaperone for outer membrane proteins
MNRFTFSAAIAALALAAPVAAPAQQLPPAVMGVVDTDRIMRECTVCAAANTQLQAQLQQLQQRAEALRTPIQTEGQAIETALRALPQGQQPDATLSQRITAFQTQQQTAQQEIGTRQQQVERNVAFVRQQIGQRIEPAIQQVMQQRGATVVVDAGATLAIAQSVDITPAVLAVVNQNTSPLNVNAPPPQQQAQQPQPQQPQGR